MRIAATNSFVGTIVLQAVHSSCTDSFCIVDVLLVHTGTLSVSLSLVEEVWDSQGMCSAGGHDLIVEIASHTSMNCL